MLANIIVFLIVVGILFLAIRYIYKAKKSGAKCIGCPDGNSCGGSCCSCNDDPEENSRKI